MAFSNPYRRPRAAPTTTTTTANAEQQPPPRWNPQPPPSAPLRPSAPSTLVGNPYQQQQQQQQQHQQTGNNNSGNAQSATSATATAQSASVSLQEPHPFLSSDDRSTTSIGSTSTRTHHHHHQQHAPAANTRHSTSSSSGFREAHTAAPHLQHRPSAINTAAPLVSPKQQQQQQQPAVLPRPVSMDSTAEENCKEQRRNKLLLLRKLSAAKSNPYAQPLRSATTSAANMVTQSLSSRTTQQSQHFSGNRNLNKTVSAIKPVSALQLLQQERAQRQADPLTLLRTNDNNHCHEEWLQLHAGVHELSGPAGTGKTQMALTCCRRAAASPVAVVDDDSTDSTAATKKHATAVRAIYISLSHHHLQKVALRLQQMCEYDGGGDDDDDENILERIWIRGCTTPEDLLELLRETLPAQDLPQLRLIVLDSVADLFRLDRDIPARSALLFQVAAALQDLVFARDSGNRSRTPLSILVLNQATADFSLTTACNAIVSSSSTARASLSSSNSSINQWLPALGLSWAHCVHSHFQLGRRERPTPRGVCFERRLLLTHSARHAPHAAQFVITNTGCEFVPPPEEQQQQHRTGQWEQC